MPCPNCGHETSPLGSHDCFAEQSRRRAAEIQRAVKDASRIGVIRGDSRLEVLPISSGASLTYNSVRRASPPDMHIYDVESPSTVYEAGDSIRFTTRITGT